jgi:hypothetical protein
MAPGGSVTRIVATTLLSFGSILAIVLLFALATQTASAPIRAAGPCHVS